MSLPKGARLENHEAAFTLMMDVLDDQAIDTCLFDPGQSPFQEKILRTTWEELERQGYVEAVGPLQYRFTARGWLVGLEVTAASQSTEYLERVGRVLAVMKGHVKGRGNSAIVPLQQLAMESGEPEGWIFNVIDSGSTSTESKRTGASWLKGDRGRLVEIPVDFNLEPVDIVSALTAQHLERIEQLEARLEEAEQDRAQFHCPYCDAPFLGSGQRDYPEYHCIVTYEWFDCGYRTADGDEESPCPYGPNWPALDEFEFITKQDGDLYVCHAVAKTERARRVRIYSETGRTREEAEQRAKESAAPKRKEARPKS